jgi:hypothetical protein
VLNHLEEVGKEKKTKQYQTELIELESHLFRLQQRLDKASALPASFREGLFHSRGIASLAFAMTAGGEGCSPNRARFNFFLSSERGCRSAGLQTGTSKTGYKLKAHLPPPLGKQLLTYVHMQRDQLTEINSGTELI